MFLQIINSLGIAVHAVYDWFWDFLHDGYGNIALTVVIGMVIFSIVYRFFLLPVMGGRVGGLGATMSGIASDTVRRTEHPHPDFSEKNDG